MGDIELELREKEDENQVGFRVHLGLGGVFMW